MLLVPNAIFIEELLGERPYSKRLFDELARRLVDIGEPNLTLVLVGEDAHHIHEIGAHPKAVL